jgi:superfamily II DNA or RNA helicase
MIEPKEFFTEALVESTTFDLGLGFFSSSGIRSLAYGFALFIANGGKMRIVINDILSENDKKAIEKGVSEQVHFEEKTLQNVAKLIDILSVENEQFFRCLSYLISVNRLEFVATVSTKGGLGHDKYGVFTDKKGDKVAFIGSANFSATALELNGETITVFTSWEDAKRVNHYQSLFDSTWQSDTKHLIHIPLDKVITHITGKFPPETIQKLLKRGVSLRDLSSQKFDDDSSVISDVRKNLSDRLVEKLEFMEAEPRFPFPTERQIQIDAYDAWCKNNYQGIFAMATGSGKTVTALNCLLKQYQEHGFYKSIIVVPTQSLAIQWEQEVKNFNFQNIVSTHTNKSWKELLSAYTTKSLYDPKKNLILITTYATFNRKDIQYFLTKTKALNNFIYIADEAHNLGSPSSSRHLPMAITKRIGLSATPERVYDEGGSNVIYQFFNSYPPMYTYRFTMKDAIDADILCHYDYYPIFVELTENEMMEYNKITAQLRKFIDSETGKYKKDADMLLLKRKRIVHKAENKKQAIANLLDNLQDNNKLKYTFVFVPEGYEVDYSEVDSYDIKQDDIHIIDEYADMFRDRKYSYHKYISGIEDAPSILSSFASGDIQVLLSMKCLDEGVDIPRAEYAIFCSSTGNPRQFVQRRGRVLRKSKEKEKATIWDLIVMPLMNHTNDDVLSVERNLFMSEVRRIVNFAVLADNETEIIYTDLKRICDLLHIPLYELIDEEYKQYNI